MKILFIGLNWLGDVVMSLPAMLAAAADHEIQVLTRPHLAEIYRLVGGFAQIHEIPANAPFLAGLQQIRAIRRQRIFSTIVLPDSLRAAIIARLCHAPSTGYQAQGRSFLLTQPLPKPKNFKQIHEAQLHFDLVKNAGLATTAASLPQPAFNRNEIADLLEKFTLEPGQPFFILAPGAAFGAAKRWPPEKFAQLALLIKKAFPSSRILISGSAAEKNFIDDIAAIDPVACSIAGQTSLTQLTMLLSQAKALIANDSGTMHLAALTTTPTIVPVGPTDMARTGSLSPLTRYVYGSEKCPAAPCRQKSCPRSDQICMQSISATAVFTALQNLVEKQS